jgi:hypothetical protein
VAIVGFVARQDISVGCRDCTCAATGRQPVTGDVESCRVGGVRSSADNRGHRCAGAQSGGQPTGNRACSTGASSQAMRIRIESCERA